MSLIESGHKLLFGGDNEISSRQTRAVGWRGSHRHHRACDRLRLKQVKRSTTGTIGAAFCWSEVVAGARRHLAANLSGEGKIILWQISLVAVEVIAELLTLIAAAWTDHDSPLLQP